MKIRNETVKMLYMKVLKSKLRNNLYIKHATTKWYAGYNIDNIDEHIKGLPLCENK